MMKKNSLHLQTSWLTIHMYFQKISKPMKHCQPNLIGHVFIFNDIYTCILKIIVYIKTQKKCEKTQHYT